MEQGRTTSGVRMTRTCPSRATPSAHDERIYINENLDLEEPATAKAYEFAWLLNPQPLKAATRSPGNSVAIT
jgi:hypothetical protein